MNVRHENRAQTHNSAPTQYVDAGGEEWYAMSAYLISQVEVLDPEAWENYRVRAAPAIAKFGGRYLVRGAGAEVIEADWPTEEPPGQTVIVVEFPSMEAVKAWYASPEYAEAYTFRGAAVKRRMIFAAGTDE